MHWLIIRAGAGPHLFPVESADLAETTMVAARVLVGFPPGHAWVDTDLIPNQLPAPAPGRELVPAYDISVAEGEPHADMLKVAVVHEPGELEAVPTALVESYLQAHEAAVRADHMAAYRQALADLPPDMLAELLAEHRHLLESP